MGRVCAVDGAVKKGDTIVINLDPVGPGPSLGEIMAVPDPPRINLDPETRDRLRCLILPADRVGVEA